MFRQINDRSDHMLWPVAAVAFAVFMVLLVLVLALALPEAAHASAFGTNPKGFEKAAKEVHDIVDGWGGTLVAVIALGVGLGTSAVRGMNVPLVVGSGGVALAAALAPDLALTLSGSSVIL